VGCLRAFINKNIDIVMVVMLFIPVASFLLWTEQQARGVVEMTHWDIIGIAWLLILFKRD